MADCPNCGTWNPDDKQVCWRCQTPLPRPESGRKPRPQKVLGLPVWAWLVLALFFLINMFAPLVMRLLQP